jgi:hypothetical protein
VQVAERYRLSPSPSGALKVFAMPETGRQYVIGSDASGGGPDGDFAAAIVLDAETCTPVARWKDHIPAIPWGRCCARLGWFFNGALLAFETFPSAHGLSAAHAAAGVGYPRLFRHRMYNRATRDSTDDLGWHTNSVTKPQMIDRIKLALDDGCDIPDIELIDELRAQRWDKQKNGAARVGAPKMVADGHDDLTIAFGVALMARDTAWVAGQLRVEKGPPQNETERFWAAREQMESRKRSWRMRRA